MVWKTKGVAIYWEVRYPNRKDGCEYKSDLWLMFHFAINSMNNQGFRHGCYDSLPQQRVGRGCITDKVSTLNLLIFIYY